MSDHLSEDDLIDVQRKLYAVRTKWYTLGLELGQRPSTLDSIAAKYSDDPSQCFCQVLKEWLKGVNPPPTWQAMVNALKSPTVAQYRVAEQIQAELPPTLSTQPQTPQPSSAQPYPKSSGPISDVSNPIARLNYRVLVGKFATLVKNVSHRLQSVVNIDEFLLFLVSLFPPGDCIPRDSVSVLEVFLAITKNGLWDCVNYFPLKHIIQEFAWNDTELSEWVKQYEEALSGYVLCTKISDHIGIVAASDLSDNSDEQSKEKSTKYTAQYYRKLSVKMAAEVNEMSMQYTRERWESVASHYRLPSLDNVLHSVVPLSEGDILSQNSTTSETSHEKDIEAKCRSLFQEEMKHGHVRSLVSKLLFMGAAGSGKTCTKHLILNEAPPTLRISTPCVERPVKVVRIKIDGFKLRRLQAKEEKIMIANIIKSRAARRPQTVSKSPPTKKVHYTSPNDNSTHDSILKPESSQMSSSQHSSYLKDDSSSGIPAVLESLEDEFVNLIQWSSGPEALMEVELVQITDSGGQPQFHEVLPAFLRGTTTCIFVQKLSEHLDSQPQVEYFDEKGEPICIPYPSSKTNLQILKHCIRTFKSIRCQKGERKVHKIIFVGTFKDRECSMETSEIKNRRLVEMLLPTFENEVVYFQLNKSRRELIFPVNARNPGKEEQRIAEEIQKLIITECCPKQPIDIPLRWYGLEISLREIVEDRERSVLSRDECFEAAQRLHFNEDSFDAALDYLDELNVIFYYRDILHEVVFCDPQVPVDKLSELVVAIHRLRENHEGDLVVARVGEWQKFQDHALVTLEFLTRKDFSEHYVPGLFTPAELVKLFRELLILADFSESEYFMPCLLQMLDNKGEDLHRVSPSSPAAPLVLLFPKDEPLLGVFCSLMVFLLSSENHFPAPWKLHLNSDHTPVCLYRNCVKFTIPGYPATITLLDSFTFFEVHVACETEFAAEVCPELCPLVRKALLIGLKRAASTLHYHDGEVEISFVCPCGEGEIHPAKLGAGQRWYTCSRNMKTKRLGENHTCWLGKVSPSCDSSSEALAPSPIDHAPTATVPSKADCPKFHHLKRLKGRGGKTVKVIEQVAKDWEELAYALTFSPAVVNAVRRNNPQDCTAACEDMLCQWLRGTEGAQQPVRWVTLIDCLRECDFNTLARDLEGVLL